MSEKLAAAAKGLSLPISRKQAVEVCRFISRKDIETARRRLNRVLELKMAVPSTKFKRDIPHRSGSIGPGRFPIKAAEHVLAVLESAVSNAENKGMKASALVVAKASACKGPTAWRYGRQSRRHAKRTHVEIVVEESEVKKKEEKPKAEKPKTEEKPKAEAKKAEPKAEALEKGTFSGHQKSEGFLSAKKEADESIKAPSEGAKQ